MSPRSVPAWGFSLSVLCNQENKEIIHHRCLNLKPHTGRRTGRSRFASPAQEELLPGELTKQHSSPRGTTKPHLMVALAAEGEKENRISSSSAICPQVQQNAQEDAAALFRTAIKNFAYLSALLNLRRQMSASSWECVCWQGTDSSAAFCHQPPSGLGRWLGTALRMAQKQDEL